MTDWKGNGKAEDWGIAVSVEDGLADLGDPRLTGLRTSYGLRSALLATDGEELACMPATEMLSPAKLNHFLEAYDTMLKALDHQVAGAYFASSLAALALGQQRLASHYGMAANLALSNITACLLRDSGGYPLVVFVLADTRLVREAGISAVLNRLHGETIRPLVESWSIATDLRPGYLWGLMPTRFNYNIELQEREADGDDSLLSRIRQGYQLLKSMDKSLFGLARNPFDVKIRWIEHIGDSCAQVRMKNVCCLYYKTGAGNYCYTCPKLSESDRERRRQEYRATQSG